MSSPDRPRLLNRLLVTFLAGMILANLGGSMFFPFFSIFLSRLGFEVRTIGIYFTLSAVFPLVFQVIGGWVSDRIGRLRSIAFGSVLGAVSWVGILLAPAMAWPLAWLLASDAVGAITRSLVGPSYDAFVAEQSGRESRARVIGLVQAIFLVVGIAGPPLGGLIAERFSYRALILVSASCYWAATLIRIAMARRVATTPAAGGEPHPSLKASLLEMLSLAVAGGVFTWILVVDGSLDIAGKLSESLLPLYLKEVGRISESPIGLLQGLSAVCQAAAMLFMGALSDRYGERYAVAAGCLLIGAAAPLFVFGRGIVAYALAYAIFGFAGGCFTPAMQSLISKVVPARLLGLAYGFLSTSLGVFSFFAPAVGGFLWKRFFPGLPFLLSAGIVLLAAVPAWLAFRR